MASTSVSRRKGLSHEESKTQTRRRLMDVGRRHFLKCGFNKAVADLITKEAGYTRGALYSNFGNKEGLLLALAREAHQQEMVKVSSILQEHCGPELIRSLCDALLDFIEKPIYQLVVEFENEALRNEVLRAGFLELQQEYVSDMTQVLAKVLANKRFAFHMSPADFIQAVSALSRGLAVRRVLLARAMPKSQSRRIMIGFFNQIISYDGKPLAPRSEP